MAHLPLRPEQVNRVADGLTQTIYELHTGPSQGPRRVVPTVNELNRLEALRVAHAIAFAVQDVLPALVEAARSQGATWQQIGDALGTTREAAWQRFAGKTS